MRKPGFPIPLRMRAGGPRTGRRSLGGVGRAQPARRSVGKPGFPTPLFESLCSRYTIVDCRFWIVDCPAGRHRAIRHSDQCGKFNRKWY